MNIKEIIKNALMAAEMRQGCTDYEPYVNALYNEIQRATPTRIR